MEANFPHIDKLVEKLESGVAHFTFINSKNETRVAFGTTNNNIVPTLSIKKQNLLVEAVDTAVNEFELQESSVSKNALDKFTAYVEDEVELRLKPARPYTRSNETISFFDIEKQAWRSCKVDSILMVHNV